jgi:hypothetical protein
MQKALHLMNIQLDNVISDITGLTGLRIIRAIVDGERNPLVLARASGRPESGDRGSPQIGTNYLHDAEISS